MIADALGDRYIAVHLDRLGTDLIRRRGARIGPWPLALLSGDAVSCACERAGGRGVRPGQSPLVARGHCPDIRFAAADPAAEARILSAIHRLARRGGLDARPAGDRTLAARVPSGPGGEVRVLVAVMTALSAFGVSARPGIADTAEAAAILARHARGRRDGGESAWTAAPGRTGEALASLPVEALDLPAGVLAAARAAGVRRIGDLVLLGPVRVAGRYGLDLSRRLTALTGPRRGAGSVQATATVLDFPPRARVHGSHRTRLGIVGGGASTVAAGEVAARPVPGSAAALALSASEARDRLRRAGLPTGTDDLARVLLRRLFDGRELLEWRPEPVDALPDTPLPAGPFVWRGRIHLPAAAPARWANETADEIWQVPTGSGAVLRLGRRQGGWSCDGAFL